MLADSRDEVVDCGNDVRLLLHHTPPRSGEPQQVVVLIHGWEGSANSTYLLSAATRLSQAGYRIVRINLRDHGNSHHLNEGMFHSCRLTEVVGAVRWVQETFPDEAILLVGFSLGGNFSLRIAAKAVDEQLKIKQVIALCPVLDPKQTMIALDEGWLGYRMFFIRKWRYSLEKKKAAFPDIYDFSNLKRFNTLRSMTNYFVQRYTEFPDLESYLNGYSLTGERLAGLTVPAKILVANDDPVIPASDLERIARPSCLTVDRSEYGGHCGFLSGYRLNGWLDQYVLDVVDSAGGNIRSK
jgi:predicted alpha/beta-fold hydrolase